MGKIKFLLLTLFLCFFGIYGVDAMTLKPTGGTSYKRGAEATFYITLERNENEKTVSAVDGMFSFDNDVFTMVSANNLMTDWTEFSSVSNQGTFSYANINYKNLITSTKQNIIKVVLKVKEDAAYGNTSISINNPMATDENGDEVSIVGGSHTVKILSDCNTLLNLVAEGYELNFNENKNTYDLSVDDSSINIIATKKDGSSSVSGDIGNKNLSYGKNVLKIVVKSESGIDNIYTINVNRKDNRSAVNTLSSLKISDATIKFNKDVTNYNVTVKSSVTQVKIDAVLADEKSSFVSGYGSRTVVLKVGKNVMEVKVKAENESVKTYTLNVTREDGRSNNNDLSELVLKQGKINFDKKILEYETTVLYEVREIDLEVKTEDSKASYEITGNKELVVGENLITIKVKAENESVKEYKIKVIRKEKSVELSNNSNLTSLSIEGYQINFNKNIYEYSLKINEQNKLNINYEKEEDTSSVLIQGNENLEDGSIIIVKVTAEDGSESEYKINIEKNVSSNLVLYIIIAVLILIIIVLVIMLIFKSKKDLGNNISNSSNIDLQTNAYSSNNMQNMSYTLNQNASNMQNNLNVNNEQNNNFF